MSPSLRMYVIPLLVIWSFRYWVKFVPENWGNEKIKRYHPHYGDGVWGLLRMSMQRWSVKGKGVKEDLVFSILWRKLSKWRGGCKYCNWVTEHQQCLWSWPELPKNCWTCKYCSGIKYHIEQLGKVLSCGLIKIHYTCWGHNTVL